MGLQSGEWKWTERCKLEFPAYTDWSLLRKSEKHQSVKPTGQGPMEGRTRLFHFSQLWDTAFRVVRKKDLDLFVDSELS